jgi:hypothetical protein
LKYKARWSRLGSIGGIRAQSVSSARPGGDGVTGSLAVDHIVDEDMRARLGEPIGN